VTGNERLTKGAMPQIIMELQLHRILRQRNFHRIVVMYISHMSKHLPKI
jgi:hypothetical protein